MYRSNPEQGSVCEIIENIVDLHEIMENIVPVRETMKIIIWLLKSYLIFFFSVLNFCIKDTKLINK